MAVKFGTETHVDCEKKPAVSLQLPVCRTAPLTPLTPPSPLHRSYRERNHIKGPGYSGKYVRSVCFITLKNVAAEVEMRSV